MDSLIVVATVLIAGGISAIAIAYVVRPLLTPGPAPVIVEDDKLSDLIRRKDLTLRAIKDLEFDYHVGKVSEEDFQRVNQRLRHQAIVLIQQIDKLAPDSSAIDDQLEAAIAAMRKTQTPPPEAVQPVPAAQPANGSRPARFCTNCGQPLEPSHKFCANCGTPAPAPALVSEDGTAV